MHQHRKARNRASKSTHKARQSASTHQRKQRGIHGRGHQQGIKQSGSQACEDRHPKNNLLQIWEYQSRVPIRLPCAACGRDESPDAAPPKRASDEKAKRNKTKKKHTLQTSIPCSLAYRNSGMGPSCSPWGEDTSAGAPSGGGQKNATLD